VWEQQAAAVDDIAPRLAHPPGHREGTARQAAQGLGERVHRLTLACSSLARRVHV